MSDEPATAPSVTLTPCQQKGLDMLQREGNVFLTGAAGTGKSFLLQHFLGDRPSADFPIVASTGAAAVLVGGRTFHSFFGLGIMEGGQDAAVARALRSRKVATRLQRACCVIIDEVSMLSGSVLQAAEAVARGARGGKEPWGGLRIVAVGDFAQLPPVTKGNQEKDWAFGHAVWAESDFQPALLSTVMRTHDAGFLRILNFIRTGTVNEEVRDFLDARTADADADDEGTRLYPHRAQAEEWNRRKLTALPGEQFAFQTSYIGDERFIDAARRVVPIPDVLVLKKGALVMMRRNDVSGAMRYVNGSLGRVREIHEDCLVIRLLGGEDIEVGQESFSSLDGDGKEVIAAVNFPVTLAWASTIHKAQGASLDRMIVDISALWEPGQAYVALSRVRSSQGLLIERWDAASIRAEPLVTAFYDSLAEAFHRYVPRPFFIVPAGPSSEDAPATKRPHASRQQRAKTIAALVMKQTSLEDMAKTCAVKVERILHYIEKSIEAGESHDLRYLCDEMSDLGRIRDAFDQAGTDQLRPVFEMLGETVPYVSIRLVRCLILSERQQKVPA